MRKIIKSDIFDLTQSEILHKIGNAKSELNDLAIALYHMDKGLFSDVNRIMDDLEDFRMSYLKRFVKSSRRPIKSVYAGRDTEISIEMAIESYFADNNLELSIVDYGYGNDMCPTWWFEIDGDDFHYIDDDLLTGYIQEALFSELNDDDELNIFSYNGKITVKVE